MNELILLSTSHIITVLLCILAIIFIPKYFKLTNEMAQKNLRFVIIFLLLVNQAMDFYREGGNK
jgi:hypothetical protein